MAVPRLLARRSRRKIRVGFVELGITMFKIAVLIWMMLGTTLAGSLVLVVLLMPNFGHSQMQMVPVAAIAGFLIGIPLSFVVAGRISRPSHG